MAVPSDTPAEPLPCCPPPEIFETDWSSLSQIRSHVPKAIPFHQHDLAQIVPPMRAAQFAGNWILPYAHKADMADQLNTDIAHIAQRLNAEFGMRTVPGFTVHPSDGAEEVGRVTRRAIQRGARIAKLHCSVGAYSVLHPSFAPYWELAEHVLWPTVVHAGGHVSGSTLSTELVQIDRLAERYPNARIIVAHSGAPACKQGIELAVRRKNVYLDTTPGVVMIPPLPNKNQQPWYDQLIELAKQGKILFGSDLPNVAMQLDEIVHKITAVFDVEGRFAGGKAPTSLADAGKEGDPLYEVFFGAANRLVSQVKPEAAGSAQAAL